VVRRRPADLVLPAAVVAAITLLTACSASTPPGPASPGRPPAASPAEPGTGQEVPGTGALNEDGQASVASVSCASAGDCSAVGTYTDGSGQPQAFVVSEVHGTWQQAEEVPGLAAVSPQGGAIKSVSCASAGNCSAVGLGGGGGFVVSQTHGTWQRVQRIPGAAMADPTSVSCASAGNCGASGLYVDAAGDTEAFVVSEVNGAWQQAEEVPGTATLNAGGNAVAGSVSCASAGNCSAGGSYQDASGHQQAFVVSEVNGAWQQAEEVPGTATLNAGGIGEIGSVSCASAGNCSASGSYADGSTAQAFVVSEVNGTWQLAEEVPGTAAMNKGNAVINVVSCGSAGNCSAGGSYQDVSGHQQAFVVSEVHGTWRQAEEVPGTATLNAGGNAEVGSVSCASAGNCVAGGFYSDGSGEPVFVAREVNGTWQQAEEVPGSATLGQGMLGGKINSVSCSSVADCVAGGYYSDGPARTQALVITER
jgi:hypothetical protein